jgi:hypothetical protein
MAMSSSFEALLPSHQITLRHIPEITSFTDLADGWTLLNRLI